MLISTRSPNSSSPATTSTYSSTDSPAAATMSGARPARDALGGDGAESESHGAAQDAGVIVHRGENQRVRQRHAAQGHGKPRVGVSEDREPVEREHTQAPLTERHGRRLGKARENATVKGAIETISGADHGSGSPGGYIGRHPGR